jgi:hypothetical protein
VVHHARDDGTLIRIPVIIAIFRVTTTRSAVILAMWGNIRKTSG